MKHQNLFLDILANSFLVHTRHILREELLCQIQPSSPEMD